MTTQSNTSYPDFSSPHEEWPIRPARYFLKQKSVTAGNAWGETQLLSLTKSGVIDRDIDSGVGKYPASFEGYQIVEPGDLIFCLFDVEETPRTVGLVKNRGMITGAYTAYSVDTGKADPRFLEYLFISLDNEKRYKPFYSGLRNTIPKNTLTGSRFSLPPAAEQKEIADFLDRELAQLDELIVAQNELTGLLGKRRQSAITMAVTKGLRAEVEFSNSTNEWLGLTPSHWQVKPLKHLVTLNPTALPESTSDEFEFNYIEISDVAKESGVNGFSRQKFSTAPSRARRLVQANDVLVSTVRTYLRAVGLVPEIQDSLPFVASTGFAALRPRGVNPKFLAYALTAEHFVSQVESRSNGISYPAINASDLVSIAVPVPPLEEQLVIAQHLDNQLKKLDALVSATNEAIDRLNERRSALVASAVTGKIDVWGKN